MFVDSQSDSNVSNASYHALVGLVAGVIAFATLSLVLTRNGLDLAETVIFACLGLSLIHI